MDTLIEVPKDFKPEDFMCIGLFCEIYKHGLSTLLEELKPHSFDQVPDWINIVELAKCGYSQNLDSQNGDSSCPLEKNWMTMQISEKNMNEDENCNQLTINRCVDPCSSKEDEDTWDDEKVNMDEFFSYDILDDGEASEIQGVIPYHVVASANNVCIVNISLWTSDYDFENATSSIHYENFEHGLCSDDFSCDENHD